MSFAHSQALATILTSTAQSRGPRHVCSPETPLGGWSVAHMFAHCALGSRPIEEAIPMALEVALVFKCALVSLSVVLTEHSRTGPC